jgi:hypothetical protein
VETKKPFWSAGIALGMALNLKIAPLIFVPAILLYLPNLRTQFEYVVAAVGTFVICSLPFLIQDPGSIKRAVFMYNSIYGVWGLTKLAVLFYGRPHLLHPPYDPIGPHAVFLTALKYFMLGTICLVSIWMNRRAKKPNLLVQCGTVVALFLFLTPGFGIQYLVWLVPFILAAGLRATLTYYVITFLYMGFAFRFWELASEKLAMTILFTCWLSSLLAALEFQRCISRDLTISPTSGSHI